MHLFSNNAVAKLSQPLGADRAQDTVVAVSYEVGAGTFNVPNPGLAQGRSFKQMATLSNDDMPGALEIVAIVGRAGAGYTVMRGQEGTQVRAWPAGSRMGARVTAGMLGSFAQSTERGELLMPGQSRGFTVNGDAAYPGASVQIYGWPVWQRARLEPGLAVARQDKSLSREVIGGTLDVHLGESLPWAPNRPYGAGDVVVPAAPNGHQYVFEPAQGYRSRRTSGSDDPGFDGTAQVVRVYGASQEGGVDTVGYWVPQPYPARVELALCDTPAMVMITEVGFVCTNHSGGTPPRVSIGTLDDPTRFATDAPLSQISGPAQTHRFVMSAGGELVQDVLFAVTHAATGTFKGRFYWRGIAIEMEAAPE